jgi:dTMP kinase
MSAKASGPVLAVMDGGEGSGKTTIMNRLRERFGDVLVTTREPGGTSYAEEIRNLILHSPHAKGASAKTLFALFWAARSDHIDRMIKPTLLNEKKSVISDRFDSSTYAYQIVAEGNRDLQDFFWKSRDFYLGACKPTHYILLDIDPVVGLRRKAQQSGEETNHFELKGLEFHKGVREGLLEFLEYSRAPQTIIDASKPLEEVYDEVLKTLVQLGIDNK